MVEKIRAGNVVLCEYVAKGEGAKAILVNTYAGDVLFREFPAAANFALYVELFIPNKELLRTTIRVELDGNLIFEANSDTPPSADPRAPTIYAFQTFTVAIPAPSVLEATWRAPGFRTTKILQKRLLMLPTASSANETPPRA